MIQIKFINATNVQLLDQSNNVVSNKGSFDGTPIQFTYSGNDFSTNDQNYYHFAITGSNVQLSGVIDSVTTKQQFINLFRSCEAITDASQLQLTATSLTEGCYANIFLDCKNLTTPPVLSATTLAMWCYSSMFGNCYSLTAAPALVATTLAKYCYYCMFYGCKSLTTSPFLPATTLTDWCYNGMFYNCKGLTSISSDFTSWSPSTATSNWVKGIDTVGDFENESVEVIYGDSNIPLTWYDLSKVPLTLVGLSSDNSIEFTDTSVLLRKNNGLWVQNTGDTINLTSGEFVSFSGANSTHYGNFSMSGTILAHGNVQSLLGFSKETKNYCFKLLFMNCSSLVRSPVLPATTLSPYCYSNMFSGCINLTAAPELPATTLAQNCYQYMFARCSSLIVAPSVFSATTLAPYCCWFMFSWCYSLTAAPELPATTLAQNCYDHMFNNCTSLSTAPLLPATTLGNACYDSMFANCSSLTIPPVLSATTLANNCYAGMFGYCSSLTAAPLLPATTLAYRCYAGMFWSCGKLATAPVLSATTLADRCYYQMFGSCTSLTDAPLLPATTLAPSCYYQMFYRCSNLTSMNVSFTNWNATELSAATTTWHGGAASGVFYKPYALSTVYGLDYIPYNWRVVNK